MAALGAFGLQQVAFVSLVAAATTRGAGGDGRLCLLRRVMRIPYWTKQREQVLKLGRRGLASALARELALNIKIDVLCGAHLRYAFGIRIECQWLDGSVSSISEKSEFTSTK